MIDPHRLADELERTATEWRSLGKATIDRFDDWEHPGTIETDSTRGGSSTQDTKSDDRLREEREKRQAARYLAELRTLTERIDSDLHRLRRLAAIANPGQPVRLKHGDMTAAQLIADGWCPSCFRDDNQLVPLGAGRYADRCRPCGDYRAREGHDPSVEELRIMHRGKSLRQRIAAVRRAS